ncbi:hypothetical protein [Streptomyces daliensis]
MGKSKDDPQTAVDEMEEEIRKDRPALDDAEAEPAERSEKHGAEAEDAATTNEDAPAKPSGETPD